MSHLINKRIDLARTTKYRLSIQADLSGFSFAVLDDAAGICLQLHHHAFPPTSDHNDLYSEMSAWCKKSPLLRAPYSSVHCSFCSPCFTLIPEAVFVPDKAATVLQAIHTINDLDEVYFEALPEFGAVCIYSLPNAITAPILKVQPETRFYSVAVPLIQMAVSLSGHTRVLFFYQNQHLYLVLMQEQQLLLCNAYYAPEFNTAFYFLSFALHQWQFNPELVRLYIGGDLSRQNKQLLASYFPLISILPDSRIALSSAEYTLQYSTLLCPCASSEVR